MILYYKDLEYQNYQKKKNTKKKVVKNKTDRPTMT